MELLQLRYFVEIAKHESMKEASKRLFVSQPSLSQSVRRLEKEHPELRKEDLAEQAGYTSMRSFYRNYHLYNDFTEE